MSNVSIITKSDSGEIHSIVLRNEKTLRAVAVSKDSSAWVAWIDDSHATFDDVKNCLEVDLQNEFPQYLSTKVLCDIEDKAGFAAAYNTFIMSDSDSFLRIRSDSPNMGNRFISREIALKENVTTSVYNRPLNEFEDLSAAANFKALRFKTDTKYTAFKLQLKALRAFFDPDIGPGGGWRCPEGTLNGGQITDRFGRGCGGMTRRLGRLLDSLPLGRSRDVPNQTDLTPQQLQRARRTVQRAGSRDLRRGERYVRRGEGRAQRQAGRVFDRQQRNNGNLAAGFRRTPEYQRRRSENVAAQVARRRQQRGQQLRRRNIERADRMVAEEISRLEPRAQREMTGRVLPPRGGATRRNQVAQLRRENRRQQSEGEGFNADEYRQRLRSMSDRELADEALSSYSRSDDQTDQQQLTNEAIDSELASRGLTDWTPNTIDSWVNRNNAPAQGAAGSQRRRRARVEESAVETSAEMADKPKRPDYFANEKRALADPVKTDVIEGRTLQQLEEVMRESENEFSYGADPSGDFEAASQFARAYNAIANEMRQAARQLQAFENGELFISEEEVNDLELFLLKAKPVLDSNLPNFDFAIKSDTNFQMPFGRSVNLGLAHPRFNDDDRLAFIEGRATFIGELNDVAFDANVPFEERMLQAKELLDDLASQRKLSISDKNTRDEIRQALRDSGRRTFSSGEAKEFFRSTFGIDQSNVEMVEEGVSGLRRAENLREQFDEAVKDNVGTSQPKDRLNMFLQLERDRHIAFDALVNTLRSNSSNPFNGPLRDDLIDALRRFGVIGADDPVDEQMLRSSNSWNLALEDLRNAEGDLFYGVAESFDEMIDNYLQRSDDVDSSDRHSFMVDLAEGRYQDAANALMRRRFARRDPEFRDQLAAALAQNLEKVFPKGVNNDSLIGLIDEAAAMGFIVQDFDPDSAVAQGRQALERRRKIISKLGKQAEERLNKAVQSAWNRRRSAMGSWMQKRYGKWNATPWRDYRDRFGDHPITPNNLQDMLDAYSSDPAIRDEINNWIFNLYEIDYDAPDGSRFSSTISRIDPSSFDNGFVVAGVISVVFPDGQQKSVGEFERVIGANSSGMPAPDTVTNVLFEMNNYDLTTGRLMSAQYIDELKMRGVDPSTVPTSRGSGFATVFNQNAWNWLKDAGFEKVSIQAGLEDGPYVWARSGFRPTKQDDVKSLWETINQELLKYETGGEDSLIRSDLQAAMLRNLSNTARNNSFNPQTSPSHMHAIMALEADVDDPAARKTEVRQWLLNKDLGLHKAEFDLAGTDLSPLDPGPSPRQTVKAPTINNSTILNNPPALPRPEFGQIATPVYGAGDIASPREIVNSNVPDAGAAVNFFPRYLTLGEIPNEFWPDVLAEYSSDDPNDSTALFYSPTVLPGIGGWVNVYVAKDTNGNLTGSGWAIKNTVGQQVITNLGSTDPTVGSAHSAVFDVVGFNLAATAGLAPYGAGFAGTDIARVQLFDGGREDMYVNSTILPLHWSVLPQGVSPSDVTVPKRMNFDADVFENAKLKGIPERAGALLHQYVIGAKDRHGGNMASFVDREGNAYVFPFDYGLLLDRDPNMAPETIAEYLDTEEVLYADDRIRETAREFYANASFAEREELRNRINATIDRMMDGYAAVVSQGFAAFKDSSLANFTSRFAKMREDSPDSDVDFELLEATERQNIVNRLQQIYSSLEFSVEDRAVIKSELIDLLLGETE